MRRYILCVLTVLILSAGNVLSAGSKTGLSDSARTSRLDSLKINIHKAVAKHKNLAAGIVLVNKNHVWIGNSGADGSARAISPNTMFRTGSISKMFVALAILKLQEQGKLDLNDKIRDLIPEVKFENKWEETDPVRIVHLLEHTSGWDEVHLVEMTHEPENALSLKQALDFHPHSRKSRWIPGSRMAYCNSGYAVAAYIVEKVSGMRYEDYVSNKIFKPLKMTHSSFFNDQLYKRWGAGIFNWEMDVTPYKEDLYRPAAALNSSPKDMAKILTMLLYRGQADSLSFLKKESIIRMESPKTTPGAKSGLQQGYGLANRTSYHNQETYSGHDGAINGGLSELAYIPESGIGHVILLNANNGSAMRELSSLIKDYEVSMLDPKPLNNEFKGEIDIEEGYYVAINPRSQNRFYQDLILSIEYVKKYRDKVTMSWIIPGQTRTYYPVSSKQFRFDDTDKIGLVEAIDPLKGKVLYSDSVVFEPISSFRVFAQLSAVGLWVICMILSLIGVLVILFRQLLNRDRYKRALKLLIIPASTSFVILLTVILSRIPVTDADILLSKPSWLSITQLILSVLFALGAIISIINVVKLSRRGKNRFVTGFAFLLSVLHLLAAIYLIVLKVIPAISWA